MNRILKKKGIGLVISAVTIVLIISILAPTFSAAKGGNNNSGYGYGYGACPRTQGYWKNHPEAWPVDTVTIGGVLYTKAEAIDILKTPVRDDMTIAMFYQLVAAKLNVANGCEPSCIEDTITAADDWMATYGPAGNGILASSPAWDEGEPLKDTLDDYNNGLLCA